VLFGNSVAWIFSFNAANCATFTNKVVAGERISEADALRLFESKDLNAVGAIADFMRQRKVGNRASYIINRYINYSNYCILSCQFCSFARKKRDADGFQLSVEEIVAKAREALKIGITELHIVGGLHPSLPFSYYTDMLRALKNLDARLQLKCFTAIEILHLAWLAKKSVEQTLIELKDGRPRLAHRRRRGNFPQGSPFADRQGQGIRRGISRRASHLAQARPAQHLHDALRPRREPRRPRGSPAAVARVAGRDARLHRA
jgi:hypothetical protein